MLGLGVLLVGGGYTACVGDDSSTQDGGGSDATTQDVVTPTDAPVDVVSPTDAPTDGPTGCAARTANDAAGVFVSQALGTDTNGCGTRNNPCQSIAYGIAAAKAGTNKTTVYVAAAPPSVADGGADGGDAADAGDAGDVAGMYVESIILDAPISIEGGWSDTGGTWTPICDTTTSTAVTIQGVTDKAVTASFSGSATLRDIRVLSKPTAASAETLYGIFATGSTTDLTLDAVVVDVAAGGIGVDGTGGTDGAPGGTSGCSAGNGSSGTDGSNGPGGAAGTFSSSGYVPTSGGNGNNGTAGANGTAGGAGTCSTSGPAAEAASPSSFGTRTSRSSVAPSRRPTAETEGAAEPAARVARVKTASPAVPSSASRIGLAAATRAASLRERPSRAAAPAARAATAAGAVTGAAEAAATRTLSSKAATAA